ncbi:hypothetical protein P280DRAFT_467801 [Massarina eburnea CBS 473.64]|uniref:RING finger domain-containing protein n=1 Tax=Massarina eburnea CBS 473.64 TaxID=1395130 RepID=A0A6A6S5I8_9PLEO|nr:hypothetical protein P280DRAFT_467801 [Massarina eburnea CBS 473.64]
MSTTLPQGRKRKQVSYTHDDDHESDAPPPPKARAITTSKRSPTKKREADNEKEKEKSQDKEKRLRPYRARPPRSYLEIKARALTQRLTVISRTRCGTSEVPREKVVMAGSTGNVYTQRIGQIPSCDCPHAKKGNQCKHIIYVLLRVLKAKENVGYQLALTPSELRDLFANAAPIPGTEPSDADTNADANANASADVNEDGNRRPIEGECPICYADFEPTKRSNIVYCKASCGNNVHKDCMQSWAAAKAGKATCPYCRANWEEDDIGAAAFDGKVNLESAETSEEGYVNVSRQLGLTGVRDYSSYHQPWVDQRFGDERYERYERDW